jgi:hypothetical protein
MIVEVVTPLIKTRKSPINLNLNFLNLTHIYQERQKPEKTRTNLKLPPPIETI